MITLLSTVFCANILLSQSPSSLFSQSACRDERLDRAYQISQLMTESYLRIAAQYANRTHNVELAQRVLQLAQQKRQNFGEEHEEQQSVFGLVAQPVNSFNTASRLVEYCKLQSLCAAAFHKSDGFQFKY